MEKGHVNGDLKEKQAPARRRSEGGKNVLGGVNSPCEGCVAGERMAGAVSWRKASVAGV